MKKTFIYIAMIAITGSIFIGCKSKQQAPAPIATDSKPIPEDMVETRITFPCDGFLDSDVNFLRVFGHGNSIDRTMAGERALQAALAELAVKLGGVASVENMRVAVSTNAANQEQFHDKMVAISRVVANNVSVAGYRTVCQETTISQNRSFNRYIVLEFGKQELVKQMLQIGQQEGHIRADYDFDRYMKMFNENLREYERTNRPIPTW